MLAALLARAGAARVLATDIDPRAVTCARDNLNRLGLADQVEVRRRDLVPEETAQLVVCKPAVAAGPTATHRWTTPSTTRGARYCAAS